MLHNNTMFVLEAFCKHLYDIINPLSRSILNVLHFSKQYKKKEILQKQNTLHYLIWPLNDSADSGDLTCHSVCDLDTSGC